MHNYEEIRESEKPWPVWGPLEFYVRSHSTFASHKCVILIDADASLEKK